MRRHRRELRERAPTHIALVRSLAGVCARMGAQCAHARERAPTRTAHVLLLARVHGRVRAQVGSRHEPLVANIANERPVVGVSARVRRQVALADKRLAASEAGVSQIEVLGLVRALVRLPAAFGYKCASTRRADVRLDAEVKISMMLERLFRLKGGTTLIARPRFTLAMYALVNG